MIGDNVQDLPLGAYEMKQLSAMPIGFLFHDPRVMTMNSDYFWLRDNAPSDVKVVGDLFTVDLFKRTALRKVRDDVYENRTRLLSAFSYYSNIPTIPSGIPAGATLGVLAERFVREYVDRMEKASKVLCPAEAAKIEKRLEIFRIAYDARNDEVFSKEALGARYGLSIERVRQLLVGKDGIMGTIPCRKVIREGVKVEDFRVHPELVRRFQEAFSQDRQVYNLATFMSENGIRNDKTLRFILDVMEYTVCAANDIFKDEPLLMKESMITKFNFNVGVMLRYFSDAALSVSLDGDVRPYLEKKLKGDQDMVSLLLDAVRASDRFEQLPGEEGTDRYALRWQYLYKFASRVVRIIYDAGESLHTQDIFDEYNRRGALYGLDPISRDALTVGVGHPLLRPEGKTGYWSLVSSPSAAPKPTVREVIDQFLRSRSGLATLDEVAAHVSSKGLVYSRNTIKTYLSAAGRTVEGHPELFVHEEYLNLYPALKFSSRMVNSAQEVLPIIIDYLAAHGGRAKMRELQEECEKGTGNAIRDTTIRLMIAKVPEALEMEKLPNRRIDVVLLLHPEDAKDVVQETYSGYHLPHHARMISAAKAYIAASEDGEVPMSELMNHLLPLVPAGRNKNMIYKVIGGCDEIESFTVDDKLFVRLKL